MFNYGIFRKTLLDSSASLLAVLVGLVSFVVLFVWIMLTMGADLLGFVSKFPFLQKIVEMSLGVKFEGEPTLNILFAIGFTHLVLFMLSWSFIIATVSRVTVGEFEKGTADLLLSMPVSRSQVYFSTSLVWLIGIVLIAFVPMLGVWIGTLVFETDEKVELWRFVAPACNYLTLNFAIGGFTSLVCCLLDRRGLAISIVIALIFVSIVINFVEPFSESAKSFTWVSILSYYRPVDIVRIGDWPVLSMLVLVTVGATTWLGGWGIFLSKDVPTA